MILIAKRKAEPSNAEKEFMKELNEGEGKIETYKKAILKIKNVIKYQELQVSYKLYVTLISHLYFMLF